MKHSIEPYLHLLIWGFFIRFLHQSDRQHHKYSKNAQMED